MKTNQFNVNTLLIVAGIAGLFWFQNKKNDDGTTPAPKPVVVSPSKILKQCYEADRVSQIALIKGLGTHPEPGTTKAAEWAIAEGTKRRANDFKPFFDMLSEHVLDGTEADLAAKLEAGK